jgi:hypothetical protein
VEVIMNAFTALWIHGMTSAAASQEPALVVTSRPTYSRYGFKENSCKHGADKCLGTVWASLLRFVATYGTRAGKSPQPAIESGALGSDIESDWVLGLRDEAQERSRKPVLFRELIVGYPTMCEALWGPDAIMVDRASHLGARQLLEDEEVLLCQRMMWDFRGLLLAASGVPSSADAPVVVGGGKGPKAAHVRVFFASRKGDWARYIVNEDEVIAAVSKHIASRYGTEGDGEAKVTVRRLGGDFAKQVRDVHEGHTIFISNHGANIIPALYMRPNSGLITLDVTTMGFFPFALCPSWLHWRRLHIDLVCNPRLQGRCNLKSPAQHNHDNRVSPKQLQSIIDAIDEIVAAQKASPKAGPAAKKPK